MRRALLSAGLALVFCAGCATSSYAPQVVARGELLLRYDGGFEMWGGGRLVARGLTYRGLPEYVRCVPAAHDQARQARRSGQAAVAMSVLGATFGLVSLGGFYGVYEITQGNPSLGWPIVGGAVGVAAVGTVMAGLSRLYKNRANGHAVDALNYYNDAVGSLGATCDDLRYPAPQSPPPVPELPPPPAVPPGAASQQQPAE
jgi:hypothetical protein